MPLALIHLGHWRKNNVMKYPTEITTEQKKVATECAELLEMAANSEGQPYDFVCIVGAVKSRLKILLEKLEN